MEKYIYDENNGLWYELQGDYYIPCLVLPLEKGNKPIGLQGQRHLHYLKEHKRLGYLNLLTSGRLNEYLASVNEQAENMFSQLIKEYADKQGVTERLKAENQLLWMQKMNNIRACVREIVDMEIIYLQAARGTSAVCRSAAQT